MDQVQFNTIIIITTILVPMIGGFWALISKMSTTSERLTKLETRIDSVEKELVHIKEDISALKSMMQTVVAYLLGHKTGTGKE